MSPGTGMLPQRHGSRGHDLIAAGCAFLLSLGAAELALRALGLPPQGFFVLVPGTDWKITAVPSVISGVSGVSRYRVNSQGIRGRGFGPDGTEYRILAVGGSTTECAQLDESEVWTHLLEARLDSGSDGKKFWVGNVGRSGLTTREHVLHLKYLLPQYPRVDAVVAMVGLNDMLRALRKGWAYRLPHPITDTAGEREDLGRAFQLLPHPLRDPAPWYRTTALWRLASRARLGWTARQTYDLSSRGALGLVHARLQRRNARKLVDSLPPLDQPLLEFRRNLAAMVGLSRARNVRLVFVTAPSTWRETMPQSERERLWFGWIGDDWSQSKTYYTTGALARAMAIYNGVLLETCREYGVECVDAAALVPRDTSMFYDDVHFTEAGSVRLADVLAGYFRRQDP